MSTELSWQIISTGSADTSRLGELLGNKLSGGEVIELASDLGGGKTTFTQGLARGLGSPDIVSSPTFTLKKIYDAGKLKIYHYDFYRLNDPGILRDELSESIEDKKAVTVVEWSDIVKNVLPEDRIGITFELRAGDPDERLITVNYQEDFASKIKAIQTDWEEIEP